MQFPPLYISSSGFTVSLAGYMCNCSTLS